MTVPWRVLLAFVLVLPFLLGAAASEPPPPVSPSPGQSSPPTASPAAAAASEFQFEGSGWGHGVGMSQYGARGQALDGRGYRTILTHYYAGTSVEPRALDRNLVVGILQRVTKTTLVGRGGAMSLGFADEMIKAETDQPFVVEVDGEQCRLTGPSIDRTGSCDLTAAPSEGARIEVAERSRRYSRGVVRVRPVLRGTGGFDGSLHVTVSLGMENYLLGLAEMPYSWEAAALKTQAVAARSYATHRVLSLGPQIPTDRRIQCWCDVFDSVSDQVYAGWDREAAVGWSRWQAAVTDTAGEVVMAPGQPGTVDGVVQAFYSSSSGGRTESKADVFGGEPYPYLVSVDDHWAHIPAVANPYTKWEASLPASTIASRVGLDSVVTVRVRERNASGSAGTVVFTGTLDGQPAEVERSGARTRTLLGLRSSTITRIFLPPFVDDDGSPFEADIAQIADRGITQGCNPPVNDRFCPAQTVTRAQMAAFLVRAAGLTEASASTFADVPADSLFADDIARLTAAGITLGCNPPVNDRFCPAQTVTRAQMAAFIVRTFGLTATSQLAFVDVPAGGVFTTDVNVLATAKVTLGCNPPDNDRFCPGDSVTRAQMAAFLTRALP